MIMTYEEARKFQCPCRNIGACLTIDCMFFKDLGNDKGYCRIVVALDKIIGGDRHESLSSK